MTDVVARIDELAAEEKCPHCDREYHEVALTRQVASMFESGRLDSNYFTREDTSPVVCDGSKFIGPRRPEPAYANGGLLTDWYDSGGWHSLGKMDWDAGHVWALQALGNLKAAMWTTYITTYTWSLSTAPGVIFDEPKALECEPAPDGVEVEFGPQNWIPAQEPVHAAPIVKAAVGSRMTQFTTAETHAPKKQGYDFSQFDWEPPTYPKGKKG